MSDKYPEDSDRRRFVKGVVGGAALAGVGATGTAVVNSATSAPGAGGGATQAMAIENTDGPAPRGMPQIPVEITSDGHLKGVWPEVVTESVGGRQVQIARSEDFKGTGVTYSQNWFQYCGVEGYRGLTPDFDSDNLFKSGANPGYDWQSEAYSGGDPLRAEDFGDYTEWNNGIGTPGMGKPATGIWRSEDAETVMPVGVLRSPIIEDLVSGERGDLSGDQRAWLEASTENGFIAWLNKCTHFCCVPGYKQTESAAKFGGADGVYCQCHQSVYDPFSVIQTLFVARPRPDD